MAVGAQIPRLLPSGLGDRGGYAKRREAQQMAPSLFGHGQLARVMLYLATAYGTCGSLAGEHGVGLEKRDFVARELDPAGLDLMRAIKRQFDPQGILNPGKGLPEVS